MRHFLIMTGLIVGNFVAWTLITMLPVHSVIIFALVIMSGVLMISAMIYFGKTMEKDPST